MTPLNTYTSIVNGATHIIRLTVRIITGSISPKPAGINVAVRKAYNGCNAASLADHRRRLHSALEEPIVRREVASLMSFATVENIIIMHYCYYF